MRFFRDHCRRLKSWPGMKRRCLVPPIGFWQWPSVSRPIVKSLRRPSSPVTVEGRSSDSSPAPLSRSRRSPWPGCWPSLAIAVSARSPRLHLSPHWQACLCTVIGAVGESENAGWKKRSRRRLQTPRPARTGTTRSCPDCHLWRWRDPPSLAAESHGGCRLCRGGCQRWRLAVQRPGVRSLVRAPRRIVFYHTTLDRA